MRILIIHNIFAHYFLAIRLSTKGYQYCYHDGSMGPTKKQILPGYSIMQSERRPESWL